MPANLENSKVAIGLEKVSFHSSPKERQSQRMFNLLHNSTHLTCWQSNAQNSPSQASTVNFHMFKLDLEKAEELDIKLPTSFGSLKNKIQFQKNIYFCFNDFAKAFIWITTNCGTFLKRWEYQAI